MPDVGNLLLAAVSHLSVACKSQNCPRLQAERRSASLLLMPMVVSIASGEERQM